MLISDWIYLGLIILSVLASYACGFRDGGKRARKSYLKHLKRSEPLLPPPPTSGPGPVIVRGHRAFFAHSVIHGHFGAN